MNAWACLHLEHAKGAWSAGSSAKKENALAAWRRQIIHDFRDVRQWPPFEGRERIIVKQRARLLFTQPIDNRVVSRLQTERAGSRIVGIAGHEMNKALGDPPQGIPLFARPQASGPRAAG